MAYFFKDIKLVENKQISSALKAIYGIGITKGVILCGSSAVDPKALLSSLPQLRWRLMVFLIKRIGLTEVDLKRYRHSRFKSFNKLMTYKTLKLKYGLPVRGQSTRTNARTSRKLRRN